MNFLHYFQPNPVIFSIGSISVHWYGLIIAIAAITAILLGIYLAKLKKLPIDDLIDLAFWLIIGGIIGARLYDVLIVDWAYFSRHLIEIFYLWTGGLAIHGAIIGGIISLIAWCKIKKHNIWTWLEIAVVVLPLAQAIGRWGNYFNSELFGTPTNLPWGIPIPVNLRPNIYQSSQYFHPAFLYESFLDLVLFIILFIFFKKNNLKKQQLLGIYLIGYGIIRFLMEFIRIDPTAMWLGVKAPQLVSLGLILIGLIIIFKKLNLKKT